MRCLARVLVLALVATLSILYPSTAALAQPNNDDITAAVTIPGLPFTHEVNTSEATVAAEDPATLCFGPLATVWYTFTPGQTVQVGVNTIGSDYDTTLAVFSAGPGGALDFVACNDDAVGLASAVTFTATVGTQYFVMAGTCCGGEPGQVGPGGNLVLNVGEPPSAPVTVTLTVDGRGTVNRGGVASISGTVTCSSSAGGFVDVFLTQQLGRFAAQGSGGTGVTCEPTPTAWSVQLGSFTGVVFGPGMAKAQVFTQVCDGFSCDDDQVTRTVRLRRG